MRIRPSRVALLTSAAALASSILTIPVTADAAPKSPWTQLSSGDGVAISYNPRVARWGQQLLVTWPQDSGPNSTAVRSRVLGANGLPAGAVSTVVDWASVSDDPQPLLLGGVPTVVFGGLRTTDSTDPYTGPMAYAQAGDGRSWALGAGSLTQNRSAYGDYGLGAVDDGTGQPVVALAASSTDHVTVHRGIDPEVPAAAPDEVTASTGEAQQVNLARDPQTGAAYAAWYSSSPDAQEGIRAAQVYPSVGPVTRPAPFSTVRFNGARESVNPGQNVALAGRIGGGVWAAYASGYPSPHTLVLWNVQTGKTLALPRRAGSIQYVGLSTAPGGRLWAWWVEGSTVYAARTNPAVTRFGVVRAVATPGGNSPTRTDGDGTLGPVDVVINHAIGGGASQVRTTRIYESLTITARPAVVTSKKGGPVVLTVSDAGLPVPNATVRVAGATLRTNAAGQVTATIKAGTRKGRVGVTASATGFAVTAGAISVR